MEGKGRFYGNYSEEPIAVIKYIILSIRPFLATEISSSVGGWSHTRDRPAPRPVKSEYMYPHIFKICSNTHFLMSKDTFKECVKSTLLIALHICGYAVLLVRERHYLCKLRCTDNVFVIDRPHCIDPIVNAYTRNNHAASMWWVNYTRVNFWCWIQWTCNWTMSVASSLIIVIISTSADPCRSSNHKNLCLVSKKSIKSFWSQLVAARCSFTHLKMCNYEANV